MFLVASFYNDQKNLRYIILTIESVRGLEGDQLALHICGQSVYYPHAQNPVSEALLGNY